MIMARRRKQNASLMVCKNKDRYTKIGTTIDSTGNINNKESDIVNNNNDDVTITDNDSCNINCNNSSNIHDTYKVNCTDFANDITTIKAVPDDDSDDLAISDETPIVVKDFNLEMKLHRQMKLESHCWSVFNLFLFKYDGLNPQEQADLYQYWTGRCGIASKIKKDLHLPRTYCVKDRMLPIF